MSNNIQGFAKIGEITGFLGSKFNRERKSGRISSKIILLLGPETGGGRDLLLNKLARISCIVRPSVSSPFLWINNQHLTEQISGLTGSQPNLKPFIVYISLEYKRGEGKIIKY